MKQLIINTEVFLQCYGHCSGCFLSETERQSQETTFSEVKKSLELIAIQHADIMIEHLIIGFGRGNLLNLNTEQLLELGQLINWCENNFTYKKISFEVSTSLIGKLEQQVLNATYLLNQSRNIFFNIVINSEITSPSFWTNFHNFYEVTSSIRKSWGWLEDWGDILVLNINPQKLPDLALIEKISYTHKSPININLFPFDKEQQIILKSEINRLNNWLIQLWSILKDKDFNMKNYLEQLTTIDFDLTPIELKNYYDNTEQSYIFIDKRGDITKGISSIMGEVDFPRLIKKYEINPDIVLAYKKMQKLSICRDCNYQKECLVSGAFLNLLANEPRMKDSQICPSGYQAIFMVTK